MLSASKWNGKWIRALCGLATVLAAGPAAMPLWAQTSSLPPTAPTTVSPSQLPSANPPVGTTAQQRAEISWDGNALQIITANVGLNSLLRDIAAKTNLQITGSAPEERIFGTYGPGKLEDVLFELLDGVAVNMLFVDRTGSERKQLVLTSRAGGPSLSSQGAQSNVTNNDLYSTGTPVSASEPRPNPTFQPADPNAARAQGNGSDAQRPTGVRTPQEIFEQLRKLQAKSAGR